MQISSCTDVSDGEFLAIDLKDTDGNRCLSTFQGHLLDGSPPVGIGYRGDRRTRPTIQLPHPPGARFDCGDRLMIILNPPPNRRNPSIDGSTNTSRTHSRHLVAERTDLRDHRAIDARAQGISRNPFDH